MTVSVHHSSDRFSFVIGLNIFVSKIIEREQTA